MKKSLLFVIMVALTLGLSAQKANKEAEKDVHQFKMIAEVKRTPVKDQGRTGTCWDFATISFLESEFLRLGKGELDLSEMYVAHLAYPLKALSYVRQHGSWNFGQGGQSHDVIDIITAYGIVPEEVYSGMNIGESRHNHSEMVSVLQGLLDAVVKRPGGKVTPRWQEAFAAVLDVYLGKVPAEFIYKGKTYNPKSFLKNELQLNPADYVELTSYSDYPWFKPCRLEIPDNWSQNGNYYNLPIDELEATIDHALKNGYSIAWDGDVSEREFNTSTAGYAIVPLKEYNDLTKAEQNAKVTEPETEKEVDQGLRDLTFGNYLTTDDHLMHIVGLAQNQKGTKFYYTKNSHGTDRKHNGFLYMSRSYVRLKTIAVMLHKDALKPELKEKLGIQ